MEQWTFDKAAFIALFSEYANVPAAVLDFIANTAQAMFAPEKLNIEQSKWDTFYFWLIAHLLALFQRGGKGAIGAIQNASEGSVSIGFNAFGIKDGLFFNQTNYGAMFWRLIRPYLTPKFVSGKPSGVL